MPVGTDSLARVAHDVRSCSRCPGMNIDGLTQSAPGFGSETSRVIFVGQSLCGPCMHTQIPFTGGSGRILDQCLAHAGITKRDVFTTNVVHCHPPNNRASQPYEVLNCAEYLRRELALLQNAILVVTLGRDARTALERELPKVAWIGTASEILRGRLNAFAAAHPAFIMRQRGDMRDDYIRSLGDTIRTAVNL
jgi:uracil-DNA glycosylase family 4